MTEKAIRVRVYLILAAFLCLNLIFLSCAVNPVTGQKELSLIPASQEKTLGEETDGEIRSQYGIVADKDLVAYIKGVGESIVPHTHRPELGYHFAVLDSPVINAFAVPGGYVYVTRGILALMSSEAELATVIGHELGHISARHSLRRLSQMILVQTGLALVSAVDKRLAEIAGLVGVGMQLLFLKYSRDDEYQADSLGVEYARKAGWSPQFMIDFFSALEKIGDLSGGRSLPGFLSTHPLTKDRIEKVKTMLTEEDRRLKVNRDDYLLKLQNLVYGDDPRQGFVEKGKFYHPQMKFVFSFPEDWAVQNTASQVRMASPDGRAALVLMVEKSAEDLRTYATQKAATIKGATLMGEDRIETGSLPSHHTFYLLEREEGETLYLRLGLIRLGEFIFSFFGLAPWRNYPPYDEKFKVSIRSLDQLKDPAYLNRQPLRLNLVRASGKERLSQIFERTGMPRDLWPKFAIMNGFELETMPPANYLVKTVWLKGQTRPSQQ